MGSVVGTSLQAATALVKAAASVIVMRSRWLTRAVADAVSPAVELSRREASALAKPAVLQISSRASALAAAKAGTARKVRVPSVLIVTAEVDMAVRAVKVVRMATAATAVKAGVKKHPAAAFLSVKGQRLEQLPAADVSEKTKARAETERLLL